MYQLGRVFVFRRGAALGKLFASLIFIFGRVFGEIQKKILEPTKRFVVVQV
jgi:hypothetical protein